ncbi:uncharacterized protein [Montipora capricornis]|uniref:uncharacterized protein n=1 Tax=Montipora capricornis TaxID=246305 RepID=UPI0035F17688
MKTAVIYGTLLFMVVTVCASNHCLDSCYSKISDIELCNTTCQQLNASTESRKSASLPTPDAPLLLSSTYFMFTLRWDDYRKTRYNASPIVYVLEVTRHLNISDPAIILPIIQKYHQTGDTTFTIPQPFITKTNFTFRLAVVSSRGTSNFSVPSPLYLTNSTCKREKDIHLMFFNETFPCPVFNVRMNFTATEAMFRSPRISSTLSWDYPHDIHTHLPSKVLELDISLSKSFPYSREKLCRSHGRLTFARFDINPQHPDTSETFPLRSDVKQMYFGCPYEIKLHREDDVIGLFSTKATFYVPQCVHGLCACEDDDAAKANGDSTFVDVYISESNFSADLVNSNITWKTSAWPNKIPAFFTYSIQECPRSESFCTRPIDSGFIAASMKTSYSLIFHNLTKGEEYRVLIEAYDKGGCILSPSEDQKFLAVPSTPTPPTPTTPIESSVVQTPFPSATPTTGEKTVSSSATTSAGVLVDTETTTANKGLTSGEVAAITVPVIILLLVGLALLLFCFRRHQRKPRGLQRAPTDLQRLGERDFSMRNRQNHSSSPYCGDYDGGEQRVKLPPKSDGGLELNPAYVEQRIQDALETGETDEFEFGYHRLEVKRILGKGAFGKVFLAEAHGIGKTDQTSLVAVKVLNEKANDDEKEDFKIEIDFMKTLGRHENVVTMLGCCTLYPPLCLIVEYVPHGDLLHYLRNLRKTFEMQNRKLQGDNIDELKYGAKGTSSEPDITSTGSVMEPRYFQRPLVASLSEAAILTIPDEADGNSQTSSKRSLLRRSKSEDTQLCIKNTFKSNVKTFKPDEGTNSTSPTDVSNTTETTLVLDTKSQSSVPSRKMDLEGALDSDDLQSFALQIANGMAYLAGRGIIHRDLAARNILVGDDKVLKISDFGLSREGIYVKRSTGKIPLRWLSIEAMRERVYSTASDVWAFGIVLWEICTLGGFPYPTINDKDLLDFLLDGNRMKKPDNCTDEIYQIMLACWTRDCEERPSFQSLSEQLFDMQKDEHPYVNVDPTQDFALPPTAGQDTVGNLISLSDGTFSGGVDSDSELSVPAMQPGHSIPVKPDPQNAVQPPIDFENAGYENSHSSSQDLSVNDQEDDGNFFVEFPERSVISGESPV